jgi:alkyl sulfatase BDS1-like metallo-beta-lactamase superfamily hydrolase
MHHRIRVGALILAGLFLLQGTVRGGEDHFHPQGKPASKFTREVLQVARDTMPFSDRADFKEADRGFIAPLDSLKVMADAGHVAWDLERFKFITDKDSYETIHPSLMRQSKLNMKSGLFKVIDGVYQVRGLDLANITFVRGKTGWIVFDPLTAAETARTGHELINKHVEKLPVVAVIYSHSHADHFGGVRGLVKEEDVTAGKVQIIAPRAFMDYAVSENIYAGNAMNRRMFYQYGVLLPASPSGHAGQGLQMGVAAGNLGLIAPSRVIEKDVEECVVDGVRMVFQNAPDTEAPSEMYTWLPEMKALWTAENVTGTLHNLYTLRGAKVRDALKWSKSINSVLYRYGKKAEVMFASHHWPRWGNARVQQVLRGQRDLYAHLNNQVLHLANRGATVNEVHNTYDLPPSIQKQWYCRGYHGSIQHNSRAVINLYLGYWDCNPATLIPLSSSDSAPLYVEMMGGAGKIIAKGKELHASGKYLLAVEILNKLIFAEPKNLPARALLADCFEQIGYQQENPGLRNSFLAGAFELRSGIPSGASPKSSGPDMIRAMSTELFLDFLGIRMDSRKVEGGVAFKINLITPDNGEKFVLELSSATLTNIAGHTAADADLTITIDRADLVHVMAGTKSLEAQVVAGKATLKGDAGVLKTLGAAMVDFDMGFEILPGTKTPATAKKKNPFEAGPVPASGGD